MGWREGGRDAGGGGLLDGGGGDRVNCALRLAPLCFYVSCTAGAGQVSQQSVVPWRPTRLLDQAVLTGLSFFF